MDAAGSEQKAREYFMKYYTGCEMQYPERLQSREIGFIPFSGTMIRHRKANSTREMDTFVRNAVPRHLYYSSAYYRKPDEKKMPDKEWLGAELIFDLDADHIMTQKKITYEETLDLIKQHTMRLIRKYLYDTFGFEKKDLRLFFSGGRGYHVHVMSDRVYGLTSDSRREMAGYIRGEGLTLENFLSVYRYVPLQYGGWVGDISRMIMSAQPGDARRGSETSPEGMISQFKSLGPKKQAPVRKAFGELVNAEMSEIDEPVTTDTHRLIRYPGSLHGKTGFMVKPLDPDDLEDFDPLTECIPDAFREGEETVKVESPFKIHLRGEEFSLSKGKNTVPLYVALYTVLSSKGQFI